MREQSAIDRATALLSQSAFRDRLQSELDDGRASTNSPASLSISTSLIMSTVMHGLRRGDEVLRTVASQIKSMAGECKYLASFGVGPIRRPAARHVRCSGARLGGDRAASRSPIWKSSFPHETMSVTASLGVAGTMQGVSSADELIERAEQCRPDGQVLRSQLRGTLRSIRR